MCVPRTRDYETKIARDWNVNVKHAGVGYVTRSKVKKRPGVRAVVRPLAHGLAARRGPAGCWLLIDSDLIVRVDAGRMRDPYVVRPTLFEFAGGEPAFLALATAHHARCLQDPELNHPFSHPGQHPQHVERLAAYWAEVMGGPPRYSQSCGDHSAVLGMHAGNGDMSDLGRRFVDCFVRAVADAGLPDDLEFRAALRAYMQWAVEEVLSYSPAVAAVPTGLAMPHWSWDGLHR